MVPSRLDPKQILRPGLLPGLLGYRLRLAQQAVFRDFAASVSELPPGRVGILLLIDANPGVTQSRLAQAVGPRPLDAGRRAACAAGARPGGAPPRRGPAHERAAAHARRARAGRGPQAAHPGARAARRRAADADESDQLLALLEKLGREKKGRRAPFLYRSNRLHAVSGLAVRGGVQALALVFLGHTQADA